MLPHAARCDRRGKKSLECWQKSGRPAPISTSPPHLDLISVCFDTFFFDHVEHLPTADQTYPQSKKLYHLKFGLASYHVIQRCVSKRLLAKWVQLACFCKRGAGHGVDYVGSNCEKVTPASARLEWAAYIWSCLKRKWKTKCEKPWVDGGAVSWKRLLSSSSEAGAASHLFVEAATINQSDTKVTKVTINQSDKHPSTK